MLGAKRKNLLREKAIQRDLENGVIKKVMIQIYLF